MLTARRIVFHVARLAAVFAHVVTIHRYGGHLNLMKRSSFCATRTERWRMHGSHRHALNQHGQGKQKGDKNVFHMNYNLYNSYSLPSSDRCVICPPKAVFVR